MIIYVYNILCFPPISWEAHKLLGHGAALSTALQRNHLPELSLLTNLTHFGMINIFENQNNVFCIFTLAAGALAGIFPEAQAFKKAAISSS